MTYRHRKGQIKENALHALLHDPLFAARIEKKRKGKGSYCRKNKHRATGFNEEYQDHLLNGFGTPYCSFTLIFK